MEFTISFTVNLWWLVWYLVVGVVTFLPLEYLAWRKIHRPAPFWQEYKRVAFREPLRLLVPIVAWPLAIWEAARMS